MLEPPTPEAALFQLGVDSPERVLDLIPRQARECPRVFSFPLGDVIHRLLGRKRHSDRVLFLLGSLASSDREGKGGGPRGMRVDVDICR